MSEPIFKAGGLNLGQTFTYKGHKYRAISFPDRSTVVGLPVEPDRTEGGVQVKISKVTKG